MNKLDFVVKIYLVLLVFVFLYLISFMILSYFRNIPNNDLKKKKEYENYNKNFLINFGYSLLPIRYVSGLSDMIYGDSIFYTTTNKKIVSLTIDDFPTNDININNKILDILKEKNIKTTFFLIGDYVNSPSNNSQRSILVRALKEGHELGNHMYRNHNYRNENKDIIKTDFDKNEKLIDSIYKEVGKERIPLFRAPKAPFGMNNYLYELINEKNMKYIIGDIYSNDYDRPFRKDAKFHINYVKSKIKKGSIIIFHSSQNKEIYDNLIEVIQNLPKDYKYITVGELLKLSKPRNIVLRILIVSIILIGILVFLLFPPFFFYLKNIK